jgi:hypothetical protein
VHSDVLAGGEAGSAAREITGPRAVRAESQITPGTDGSSKKTAEPAMGFRRGPSPCSVMTHANRLG